MLGIDIGSYAIKVAVVKGSGKKVVVSKILYEVIPPEVRDKDDTEAKRKIIAGLIKRAGRNEKTVALSIPTSAAILKNLDVANDLSEDELEGEIQLALINLIPFPLEQVYLDFVRLGRKKDNPSMQEILVATTRKEVVDAVAENIQVKSIRDKIVDLEATAVGLLIEKIKGKNYRDAYAVIDIGYTLTSVYVFAKNELLFTREQQIGGQQLTESIAETMGISMEDAETTKLSAFGTIPDDIVENYVESFVEQIALAFELYSSTNTREPNAVYLTGGGSHVTALIPALQNSLSQQEVELLPISDSVKINDRTDNQIVNSLSAVSIGLALRS